MNTIEMEIVSDIIRDTNIYEFTFQRFASRISKELIVILSIQFSYMFCLMFAAFQRKRAAIRLIPWTLNHRRQLFVIINPVRLVEGRNIAIEEIVEMRRSASRVSTNVKTDTETSIGIVGMWESLWKDPNVWKAPREIAREWSD